MELKVTSIAWDCLDGEVVVLMEYDGDTTRALYDKDQVPSTGNCWLWFEGDDDVNSMSWPGDRVFFPSKDAAWEHCVEWVRKQKAMQS